MKWIRHWLLPLLVGSALYGLSWIPTQLTTMEVLKELREVKHQVSQARVECSDLRGQLARHDDILDGMAQTLWFHKLYPPWRLPRD